MDAGHRESLHLLADSVRLNFSPNMVEVLALDSYEMTMHSEIHQGGKTN